MSRVTKTLLLFLCAFAIVTVLALTSLWQREQRVSHVKIPPPFPPPILPVEVEPAAAGWNTFSSKELGISFAYPKEYYVELFTEKEIYSLGIYNYGLYDPSPPPLRFFITVADPQETSCAVPYEPCLDNILNIRVFPKPEGTSLEAWVAEKHRQTFWEKRSIPPLTINGIQALRFFQEEPSGEGYLFPKTSYYDILFEKDDLFFHLFTAVSCSADGNCEPPRDEQFIAEIDTIAKTIQFTR